MLQPRTARGVHELLGREGGDLDAEQPAGPQVLPGVAQECQGVVRAQQAKERVEGADGQAVPASQLRAAHVALDPGRGSSLLPAPFDHRSGQFDARDVEAFPGERDGETSCACSPLDDGVPLAPGHGEPERDVVVVDVLEVVEFGQGVVLGQGFRP